MATSVQERAIRAYVIGMFAFMSRGLAAVMQSDPLCRAEAEKLPEGFVFEMKVLPSGPAFRVKKEHGTYRVDNDRTKKPTLSIQVKHIRHALAILLFTESTKQAIANNRLVVDGDLSWAMRTNRILARMQEILLPPPVATLANEVPPQFDGLGDRALATMKLGAKLAQVTLG